MPWTNKQFTFIMYLFLKLFLKKKSTFYKYSQGHCPRACLIISVPATTCTVRKQGPELPTWELFFIHMFSSYLRANLFLMCFLCNKKTSC